MVANTVKGLRAHEAEALLSLAPQKSAEPLLKLLRSAVSNAKNTKQLEKENLFIKEIRVDEGPTMKRFIPRAMGRATPLEKRSSHVTLVLAESEEVKEPRFQFVKREKISKTSKAAKPKKEAPKTPKEEPVKPVKQPGFMRRVFRRKAV